MESEGPVTVVVRHRVKPGRETAFEQWQRGINEAALKFTGHLGFHVVRPSDPKRLEYLVIFKFDTLANLERWEQSDERRTWLEKVEPFVVHAPALERHTGMEVWFTPPPGRGQPARYKMVVVTFLALYPLISLVQATLSPHLSEWPLLLRTLTTTVLLILVMTYAAMPLVTRLLSRWLYPNE
jgi:antibiotic biosynthesis monooxygenase (ABM) superfamily enzyme